MGLWVAEEGLCAPTVGLHSLRIGSKITIPMWTQRCENPKRKLVRYTHPSLMNLQVHESCIHNELRSLLTRVVAPTPKTTPLVLSLLKSQSMFVANYIGQLLKYNHQELLSCFPSSRRRMYHMESKLLLANPLNRADASVRSFCKSERLDLLKGVQQILPTHVNQQSVEGTVGDADPRMIQARHPRFNWEIGAYTRKIEKHLYQLKDHDGHRVMAKGLNYQERHKQIVRVMSAFQCPKVISMDISRWDMHVNVELRRLQNQFYLQVFNHDSHLQSLLDQTILNRGTTTNGIKYVCPGGVMSGDMTTALGNCLLVHIILGTFQKASNSNMKWIIDGDDFIVVVNQEDTGTMINLTTFLQDVGLKVKITEPVYKVEDVIHCSHSPITIFGVKTMYPNPRKIMARSLCVTPANMKGDYLPMLWSMRAILHQGQPILGPFFARLAMRYPPSIKQKIGNQLKWLESIYRREGTETLKTFEVDPQARETVARVWGVPVAEQLYLEHMIVYSPINSKIEPLQHAGFYNCAPIG